MASHTYEVDRATMLAHLGNWLKGPGPLAGRLSTAIAEAITRGDLPPGTRLPAERLLAGSLAVGRGTVVAAYERLRERGWLDSRQGSGTWVRPDLARPLNVNDRPGSALRSRRLSGRLFRGSPDVIDLATSSSFDLNGLSEGMFSLPDPATLGRLSGGHGYQPLGLPALRDVIGSYYCRECSLPTDSDQIIVTGGAQQAIALVCGLLVKPGDAVVVESATYPGALDAFSRAAARIVTVPAAGDWAGTDVLRDAVRRHAARLVYLMPACHNPLGQIMTEARRREIARLADEHEVCVVEDNTLADVVFRGGGIPPIAAHSRAGRVLTLGSLSKVSWGGLRIGWLRGPVELIDRLGRLKAAADFGLSVLSQVVACNVLDNISTIAASRRALLRERADLVQEALAVALPCWRWSEPDGGLSLWIRLPYGNADDFNQHALRAGVDFTPGSAHGVDEAGRDCLRLSYGQSPEVLREGIARLVRAWRPYELSLDRAGPGDRTE